MSLDGDGLCFMSRVASMMSLKPRLLTTLASWKGELKRGGGVAEGAYQELRCSQVINDNGLCARNVHTHLTMHTTALEADEHPKVHRQPLWIWQTQVHKVIGQRTQREARCSPGAPQSQHMRLPGRRLTSWMMVRVSSLRLWLMEQEEDDSPSKALLKMASLALFSTEIHLKKNQRSHNAGPFPNHSLLHVSGVICLEVIRSILWKRKTRKNASERKWG